MRMIGSPSVPTYTRPGLLSRGSLKKQGADLTLFALGEENPSHSLEVISNER